MGIVKAYIRFCVVILAVLCTANLAYASAGLNTNKEIYFDQTKEFFEAENNDSTSKVAVDSTSKVLADSTQKKVVRKRMDRGIKKIVFMPKGQLFAGLTASFMEVNGRDFDWLVVEDIDTRAYTTGVSASGGYCFADDLAFGVKLKYGRTMVRLDNLTLKLSDDMTFGVKDFYSLDHSFTGNIFFRTYINIGQSKRFAMFNDVVLYGSYGQGKIQNGKGETIKGTFQTTLSFGLSVSPGLTVFVTDFMTVDASVGILGIGYKRVNQVKNQVYQGSLETITADFKINLLAIGLGLSLYF